MSMKIYKPTAERLQQLLEAACVLAEQSNYRNIRRHHLSAACSTSDGNVSRVMGSMNNMRSALIEYAIKEGRHIVVAQAIIDRHPATNDISNEDRVAILTKAA